MQQALFKPLPKVANLVKLPPTRLRVTRNGQTCEGEALHAVRLVEFAYARDDQGNPVRDQMGQPILQEVGLKDVPPIGLCFRTDSGHDLYCQPDQMEEIVVASNEAEA